GRVGGGICGSVRARGGGRIREARRQGEDEGEAVAQHALVALVQRELRAYVSLHAYRGAYTSLVNPPINHVEPALPGWRREPWPLVQAHLEAEQAGAAGSAAEVASPPLDVEYAVGSRARD